ncbi:MAG: hypothetical protein ACFCVE_00985, partial [Phycisphaerae bacterium]
VQFARPDGQGNVRRVDISEQTLTQKELQDAQFVAAQLIRIRRAFEQDMNFVKITEPMVNRQLARDPRVQTLNLTYTLRDADDYLAEIPEPSDAQLQTLFDAFRDLAPGSYDQETNPMGFGYRLPERVKFDALLVRPGDVRGVVEASMTREAWLDAAAEYFLENVRDFDVEQPTTPPSRMSVAEQIAFLARYFGDAETPTDDPQSAEPATQPATQPADQPADPDTIARQALDRVLSERTAQRLAQMTVGIRNAMQQDYDAYRVALRRNEAPPTTGLGAPYNTPAYLDALAGQIAERFGIRPDVRRFDDRFYGAADLADLAPFAGAATAVRGGQVPFEQYVTARAAAFMPDATDAAGLRLFQPSPTFDGADVRFIYRLSEVADDEPATDMAAARDQLVRDYKARASLELALERAQALAQRAAGSGLRQVADSVRNVEDFPENLNRPDEPQMLPGIDPETPEGLAVLQDFAERVYDMLGGLEEAPGRATPVTAFPLPRARLAVTAELTALDPHLQSADALLQRKVGVENALMVQTMRNLYLDWFTPTAIKERADFVPRVEEGEPEEPA